ncbi:MAG: MoeZ/MoeB [Opitutia bacterium TMED67]|nr:MoeZ/MoeB [Verrucomicrobiales bacterium]OUU72662.1 MAG: MoeZ/MoeB [Opitutae bacterium TMED67]|tara:strand:+ start:763 stop:1533 length:771 start_codon:yes stop_codon:yes gene_type:complete
MPESITLPELTDFEREVYSWQTTVPGFGEEGQRRLKGATVMISRIGGLGGLVAFELAAAGVGRLVLAHGGNLKPSDLNRQLLMRHDAIGQLRIETAVQMLKGLNPRIEIVPISENVSKSNASELVAKSDLVVDCAPLFEERYAMNDACVRLSKPMVECAMFETEAHITSFAPGKTGCLRCLYPEKPHDWQRRFPVIGAVSGMVGCLGAMEVIKILTGLGVPLYKRLLNCDLRSMSFHSVNLKPSKDCQLCSETGNY